MCAHKQSKVAYFFEAAAERSFLSWRWSSSTTVLCSCASCNRPSCMRIMSRRKLQSDGNRSFSGTLQLHERVQLATIKGIARHL